MSFACPLPPVARCGPPRRLKRRILFRSRNTAAKQKSAIFRSALVGGLRIPMMNTDAKDAPYWARFAYRSFIIEKFLSFQRTSCSVNAKLLSVVRGWSGRRCRPSVRELCPSRRPLAIRPPSGRTRKVYHISAASGKRESFQYCNPYALRICYN